LREEFDPVDVALTYQANGASAVSVLTDEEFFGGRLEYLDIVRRSVNLPLLRKDFIIDRYQIYEAAAHKADAFLLIADILSQGELKEMLEIGRSLGLDALTEIHNEEDLAKALSCGCDIIGINNRNLHDFKVDLNTARRLVPLVPKDKVIVAESGIKDRKDVMFLKSLGVNAILVGEVIMRSQDMALKVRELTERE
jgi:indole-3-glycerol phosphate synthase